MAKKLLLFALVATLLASCKEEPAVFTLGFEPEVDGSTWRPEVGFTTNGSDQAKVDRLQFYISNVILKKNDGSEEFIDSTYFIDLINGPSEWILNVAEGDYSSVCFSIGVPDDRNLDNPAKYNEDHPLSLRRDMHWNWSTGYIFAMVEGDWDSTGTGNFEDIFLYHPGTPGLYQSVCFDEGISVGTENPVDFRLKMEIPYLLASPSDTFNLSTENFTHSTPVGSEKYKLAERLIKNLAKEAIYRP